LRGMVMTSGVIGVFVDIGIILTRVGAF
jgi:hypothetical protein